MVNIHNVFQSINGAVPYPQLMIDALEQLQAKTIHTASHSVYIYDLIDQQTLYASCSVVAMLGYTPEAIHANGPEGLANLIHPDDLERVADHYQRFTTLRYGEVISIQYRMLRAGGDWCWLRSQETPLIQAIDGYPLQVVGLLQDVTQLSAHHDQVWKWHVSNQVANY